MVGLKWITKVDESSHSGLWLRAMVSLKWPIKAVT
jgi:hypothetical protein